MYTARGSLVEAARGLVEMVAVEGVLGGLNMHLVGLSDEEY